MHALLGATSAWKYTLITVYLVCFILNLATEVLTRWPQIMLAFSSTLMINHLAVLGEIWVA
jgi:hypothetical protein